MHNYLQLFHTWLSIFFLWLLYINVAMKYLLTEYNVQFIPYITFACSKRIIWRRRFFGMNFGNFFQLWTVTVMTMTNNKHAANPLTTMAVTLGGFPFFFCLLCVDVEFCEWYQTSDIKGYLSMSKWDDLQ